MEKDATAALVVAMLYSSKHGSSRSSMKFQSHCGWPSFDASLKNTVDSLPDNSHGTQRVEIVCSKVNVMLTQCGCHLGHLFEDGPTATGMRYCVNSLSVKFLKNEEST
jgi:peptide-methionine (R)-S-oxide reductase